MITPEQLAGDSEASQQKALMCWASLNRPTYPQLKWLHAIPNANSHRQVAEGVRGGVADVFLPWPIHREIIRHGLYIELKTIKRRKDKNGGLSDEQIEFGKYAKSVGYQWYVAHGWEEASERILDYLK